MSQGAFASLQCIVPTGDTPVTVTWRYPDSDGVRISKVAERISLLTIDQLGGRHAGNYTCIASNHAGNASHTTKLSIDGSCLAWHATFQLLLPVGIPPRRCDIRNEPDFFQRHPA